jgi:hypothetical protein
VGPELKMLAEREGLLVELSSELAEGRTVADLEYQLDPLDEGLHVALVSVAVVVENGIVLYTRIRGSVGRSSNYNKLHCEKKGMQELFLQKLFLCCC